MGEPRSQRINKYSRLNNCLSHTHTHTHTLFLSPTRTTLSLAARATMSPFYHTRARGKQIGVSFLPQTHLYHNGSDEEEERSLTNEDNSAEDLLGKPKKSLLWQRMKWKDDMVRLLISTVASVEDDDMHSLSTRLPPSISQSN